MQPKLLCLLSDFKFRQGGKVDTDALQTSIPDSPEAGQKQGRTEADIKDTLLEES